MKYWTAIRLINGYNLRELGEACNVSRQTLTDLENGHIKAGKEVTAKLETFFDESIDTLMEDIPTDAATVNVKILGKGKYNG